MINPYTRFILPLLIFLTAGCTLESESGQIQTGVELVVLGNVQDGGSPHAGCNMECCRDLFQNPDKERMVSSLGLVDHDKGAWFMMDASPDFPRQLKLLKTIVGGESDQPNGIFLTHAHIGHYTGLMFLGREAMSSSGVPVYVMPRMKYYLENNGPWNQLIALNNIKLRLISEQWSYNYEGRIKIEALLVPHRDEYSETVAFMITGPEKKALYIPDIDKWSRWNRSIDSLISEVDYALIDGTFFDGAELPGRDMNEIPHPFVVESMDLLSKLSKETRSKVYFIHLNHSNPLLKEHSNESRLVEQNGFHIARFNLRLSL